MIAHLIAQVLRLNSQDLCALIGVSLIGLGIAIAVLRKIGDWS